MYTRWKTIPIPMVVHVVCWKLIAQVHDTFPVCMITHVQQQNTIQNKQHIYCECIHYSHSTTLL